MTRTVIRDDTTVSPGDLVFDQPGDYLVIGARVDGTADRGEGLITIGPSARAYIAEDAGNLFSSGLGYGIISEGGFIVNRGVISGDVFLGESNNQSSTLINFDRIGADTTVSGNGNYIRNIGRMLDMDLVQATDTTINNSGFLNIITIGEGHTHIRNFGQNPGSEYTATGEIWSIWNGVLDTPASGNDGLFLRNDGLIRGITLDNAPDDIFIRNTGTIESPARLGLGDDIYLGHDGLQSQVLGGGGDDYLKGGESTSWLNNGREDLFGQDGDDFLISGPSNGDYLIGGRGDDRLVGSDIEGEITIAFYYGSPDDYLIELRDNGAVIVTDTRTEATHPDAWLDGRDVLTHIDILEFRDGGNNTQINIDDYFG